MSIDLKDCLHVKTKVIKRMREIAEDNSMTYFELLDVAEDAARSTESDNVSYDDFNNDIKFELLVARTILALEDEDLSFLYVEWTGDTSPLAIERKLVS